MSTQYTPGPWTYHLEEDGEYFKLKGADGRAIVDGCGCCDSPWCRNEADARLIAAAPDLLEALKGLAKDKFGLVWTEATQRAGDKALAAIAKATGGAV